MPISGKRTRYRIIFVLNWLVGLLVLATSVTAAADITTLRDDDALFVFLKGRFQAGDDKRLLNVILEHAQETDKIFLSLDSEGGRVLPALVIGRMAHEGGFATVVTPGARCLSACALAWLGGKVRIMSRFAIIGFHAAYTVTEDGARESGMGNALVGAYLRDIGLTLEQIAFVTIGRPDEMVFLTPQRARRLGLDVAVLEEIDRSLDPAEKILSPLARRSESGHAGRQKGISPTPSAGKSDFLYPYPKPDPVDPRRRRLAQAPGKARVAKGSPNRGDSAVSPGGHQRTELPPGKRKDILHGGVDSLRQPAEGRNEERREILEYYRRYLTYFRLLGQLPHRQAQRRLARLTGTRILFFGKRLSRAAFLKRQRRFSAKWARIFKVDLNQARHYCTPLVCTILAPVSWILRHRRTGEVKEGLTLYALYFARPSSNLIGVHGDVVYQRGGTRKGQRGKRNRRYNFRLER